MEDRASLSITEPSIAKSASIATIGKSWGSVGVTGRASFELQLPLSAGRGFDPAMVLSYDSQGGNGPFGIGWHLGINAITRRTSKGVPDYLDVDIMVGPGGEELMPELDDAGRPKSRLETRYRELDVGEHSVVRYWPRVERSFDLIELWQPQGKPPFWLVHGANGSLHVYGKTDASRRAEPVDPANPDASPRIGVWLLLESMTPHGEHTCFDYKPEDHAHNPDDSHDYRAQRYLHRVCYGNALASNDLYAWTVENPANLDWHFHLVFDYGERTLDLQQKPLYGPPFDAPGEGFGEWQLRSDPIHSYTYGFELSTRRLCHQVLMFHHFPQELGAKPVLVRRLLLQYQTTSLDYTLLVAAHYQAYDASGAVENMPPVEFDYSGFELNTQSSPFLPFENMPGIEDSAHHQCVDLFGEGVPGFLCRYDQSWYYREPLRAMTGGDDIHYGPWTQLQQIPVADRNQPAYQALTDLTGDGRLDWILASPGTCGFHTLNPDRSWSGFIPFTAFPVEFFHTFSQSGDFMGNGLSSMALIGPRSVRLYPNRREDGFGQGLDVPRKPDSDSLPLFSHSRSELVMLGNLLGSDMSELCRIRHDEIKCWPNLGHGRFGKGFVMSALPFDYATFDSARVRIADLDGSGAPALIYLKSDCFEIYLNHGGNGLEQMPVTVPWPDNIRYDNLCQVTLADLQGLGCASLILTVPHMSPRHWRYDFVSAKPYMLVASNNNMGCSTGVVYRSSAQEFLRSKHGVKSILKGAIAGTTVASALGSVVPGIGTGIGAAVGMVAGAIAMPLLRYYFFKKGLQLAQTLHTQEIKNGLGTAVDTSNKVIEGAQSIVSSGREAIDKIKQLVDSITSYPQPIQDMFYKQLGELSSEAQRQAMKLLNSGMEPFEAISQTLEMAKAVVEQSSEADGANQRLAELSQVVNTMERPVPKPRKPRQQLHRTVSESAA